MKNIHRRDIGEQERQCIKKITTDQWQDLTGIEIAKRLMLARIIDSDNKIPVTTEEFEFRMRINEVKALNNQVERITIYQFRIDNYIDIYPKGGKYFNQRLNQWGKYPVGDLQNFIDYINENK